MWECTDVENNIENTDEICEQIQNNRRETDIKFSYDKISPLKE